MAKKRLIPILIALLLLVAVSSVFFTQAQTDAGDCPTLVEEALAQVGNNCEGMSRNSACYGFNRVAATFNQVVADDYFTTPSDKSDLLQLQTIQTSPLNAALTQWGIAVMNVQANVPNTFPGQGVVFLLLGDAQVENAVPPDQAVVLGDAIPVTTLDQTNVRSGPGENSNVLASAPPGSELPADGLSPDGEWLRVLFQHSPAWVNRWLIETPGDLASLPIITANSRTPMQSFYFSTGIGDPQCNDAPPSLLVVQGPQNVAVELTANGADIRIGSTIGLRSLPDNQFQLLVLDGGAYLGNLIVPAGFTITGKLSDDGQTFTGEWVDLIPMTADEIALLLPLENLPSALFNYAIHVPTLQEVQQTFMQVSGIEGDAGAIVITPGLADCRSFRATSPTQGMAYGNNTFYWNPAPGATAYRVVVYNNGQFANAFETNATNTSLVAPIDNDNVGEGIYFSYQVLALVNGQVACASQPISLVRSTSRQGIDGGQSGSSGGSSGPPCDNDSICEPGDGEWWPPCMDCFLF